MSIAGAAGLTEPNARAFHRLRVARIVQETRDAKSFVFEIPGRLAGVFRYDAGQFLTLEVPHEAGALKRCYSLASCPRSETEHKVTVKRVAGGRASNWLNDHVRAGDAIGVLPPEGRFVLSASKAPLVFFAGGSGITPVVSLLKAALSTTGRLATLFYANRNDASIIFRAEIAALAARYSSRFRVVHRLDEEHGVVTPGDVFEHVSTDRGAEYYLCGPKPFMDVVEGALVAGGVSSAQIRIERFASLGDARAAETKGGDVPDTLSVELRGEHHQVPYAAGKSILAACRDAGLDAPYSCEEGFCGCCAAQLVDGRVRMDADDALSADEKRRGLILTCQSRPLTRTCRLRYD